jgi:glyoxylase I family protein
MRGRSDFPPTALSPVTRARSSVEDVKPIGVHHVSINVDDVDAALTFYTEVLGLEQRKDRPDFGFGGAWLDAGGQQVHLIEAPLPTNHGQHFALHVGDLDGVVDELRARGLKVSDPVPVGPGRQAFVNDPAGNTVELNQPG